MTNTPTKSYTTPEDALKDLFGYPSFRPGQKAIIDSILSGRDAFAVMPTGAGNFSSDLTDAGSGKGFE